MAANLTFFDNFSSLSLWNGTNGTWNTNYWYNPLNGNGGSLPTNGEQEWYINSNDPSTSSIVPWTVSDGILTITGNAAPSSIQPLINNYQYTSGELNTYNSFSQTYGYFEMRAELPAGQGLWPAFWMIPENGSWPPEIDIMEVLGNNPSELYTTVHSGTSSNEVSSGVGTTVANTSTSYNEYAVSWTASTITWYYNGQEVYQTATPPGVNVPMYMEVNLAMGGGWPGDINSSTPLPAQMRVANVEAYSSDPGTITTPTTFTANNTPGQVLLGSAGYDVFYAGTNSVIMTGDGLTNTYIYNALPTAAGQITDFDPGADTINLSGLLQSVGYTGTNPFGDGTLSLVSDGKGGTDVVYNHSGSQTTIVELDNVAVSAINASSDFIITGSTSTGGASSTSSGSGSTSSGSGSTSSGSGSTGGSGTGSTSSGSSGTSGTGDGSTSSSGTSGSTGADPTLTANGTAGQVLTATTPNDTFIAGQNSVVMTEDGGHNTFVYTALPYNAGQITNFNPTTDTIDVSALLTAAGYTGTSPFGDGTLSLKSDGNGGTDLMYNPPGAGSNGIWPITIVDLQNVLASSLNISTDFITSSSGATGTSSSSSSSSGSTGTSSTSTSSTGTTSTGTSSTGSGSTNSGSTDTGSTSGSTGTTSSGSSGTSGGGSTTSSSGASGSTGSSDPTLTANGTAGQVLTATTPNDTFVAGQNSVVMTEDGGTNTFVYTALPYNAGQITNFNPATDKIDVTALLQSVDYTGTNPFADGTLSLKSDGHGGTDLMYNPPAAGSNGTVPITIVDLDNVAPSVLNISTRNFVTSASSSTTATSTGSTGSGTGTSSTGSSGTSSSGSSSGSTEQTFTATGSAGQILAASSPDGIFIAGQNSVVMTEDGGPNTFVFTALPYNAGQITDFNPAEDTINLVGLLKAVGYTGANPFGDGTLSLVSDGHNGTDVMYNPPGAGSNGVWPITIVDLDNVAPSALHSSDFITSDSGTSTSGTGSTGVSSISTTSTGTSSTSTGSSGSTSTGSSTQGLTLTANGTAGQVLHATTAGDTFIAGQNSVVMTEDGGHNTFVYSALPYNAGQITNFNPAADTINVSALLQSVGYTGTNPFGDGTLSLSPDGHSGTDLIYNPPGAGSNGHWPITIVDIDNVGPSSLNASDFITSTTTATSSISNAGSTSSSTAGVTLTANGTADQILNATTPNDTFIAGQNSVVMTEDGGSNSFVYTALPYNAGQITNFNPATDTINLATMLHSAGYAGANPFGDGTLSLVSDGQGGTNLMYNPPGAGSNGIWPIKVVDIEHVAPAGINTTKDFILH